MTSMQPPQCFIRECIHFKGPAAGNPQIMLCKAFPAGIPSDIAYGDNKHLVPQRGDKGVVFEKKSDPE